MRLTLSPSWQPNESTVVVVTGASAGVGRATAVAFGRLGCRVALLARGEDGLRGAAREVETAGGSALIVPVDMGDAEGVEAAAGRVESELGEIRCWINAAMATIFSPLWKVTPEEFERATRTTYLGTVFGTMSAIRRMRYRDSGTIVQVGSALSYQAIPLQAPYCGAKFAIRGFTDSLRCELLHEGSKVHLCMVQLSAHNTPQFEWGRSHVDRQPQPVPPIFEPEVAARAIVFAATHRRRELYSCFPAVKVIFGKKFAPRLLERYLADAAWDGQFTNEALPAHRVDNLFAPAPGDYGIDGPFGDRARSRSAQLWLTMHRVPVVLATVAVLLSITLLLLLL